MDSKQHPKYAIQITDWRRAERARPSARSVVFKAWPSEQNRVAATHLLPVPELKWAKEEGGLFYLARSEYDLACGQV